MITDKEIQEKAAEYAISPIEVEKDYVYGWLLKVIYGRPALAERLVLKGGQAIRKAYLPTTRFSKDLDFSVATEIDKSLLENELRAVCEQVGVATGIQFTNEIRTKDKNLPIPNIDAFEVRLYFKGFYQDQAIKLRAQLDITQFDQILLPIQNRKLIHSYSDAAACNGTIRCQKLEEILASKLTAVLHRRRCGDIFDLLYSILVAQDHQVSRREVVSTFLKKSIFENGPADGKQGLLAVPIAKFEAEWANLIVPSAALMGFAFVSQHFAGLINELFAALAPILASGALVAPAALLRGAGVVRRGGGSHAAMSTSDARSIIVNSGRDLKMIELTYDGYRRLVEPYDLKYYVRKSDGRGSEYFWGWDTTGGKSGKQGIKMFYCDKIQGVTETAHSFSPRFPVAF